MIKSESDNALIKAYEASHSALIGINFNDFKQKVRENSQNLHEKTDIKSVEKEVERFLDKFKWKEVT